MNAAAGTNRPRYAPERSLPPYSYVPGRHPHPVSDPRGHLFGAEPPVPAEEPDPHDWHRCREYLYGIDLFNHGYYWEAHEVWEGLWKASDRHGLAARFLKGLIKLAAAGVKRREGRAEGVRRHARRAAELFARSADGLGDEGHRFFGLLPRELAQLAADVAEGRQLNTGAEDASAAGRASEGPDVAIVFTFVLRPEEDRGQGG